MNRGIYYVDGRPYDDRVCGGGYGITGRGPFTSAEMLNGFSDDARTAMQKSPDYFVWWYTVKSVGLGVVAAGLAYMIGRATAKGCR